MGFPWLAPRAFRGPTARDKAGAGAGAADARDKAEAAEAEAEARDKAEARSRAVFQRAVAVNRAWQDAGPVSYPQRVSGAFLAECDDVTSSGQTRNKRVFGAPSRCPMLTGTATGPAAAAVPQPAGLAETILDYVQFGSDAVDGETARTLVTMERLDPQSQWAGPAAAIEVASGASESDDCLRYPCLTFWDCCCKCDWCDCWDCCCVNCNAEFVVIVFCVTAMAMGLLFGLSYGASIPFAPTHVEQRCRNGYRRRDLPCDPYDVTVHDMSWRSMGIGLGIALGCLATVVGCTALCCCAYFRESQRKAEARRRRERSAAV